MAVEKKKYKRAHKRLQFYAAAAYIGECCPRPHAWIARILADNWKEAYEIARSKMMKQVGLDADDPQDQEQIEILVIKGWPRRNPHPPRKPY